MYPTMTVAYDKTFFLLVNHIRGDGTVTVGISSSGQLRVAQGSSGQFKADQGRAGLGRH